MSPLSRFFAVGWILILLSLVLSVLNQATVFLVRTYSAELGTMFLIWNLTKLHIMPIGYLIFQSVIAAFLSLSSLFFIQFLPDMKNNYSPGGYTVPFILVSMIISRICCLMYAIAAAYFHTSAHMESHVLQETTVSEMEKIQAEQANNFKILSSTLPSHAIEKMQQGEQSFDAVQLGSVLISRVDGVNYDNEVGIQFLNEVYAAFDSICDQFKCQKIKSVQNEYVVITTDGGNCTNAETIAHLAVSFSEAVQKIALENTGLVTDCSKVGTAIAIASGPFTCGVLGTTKVMYDVIGETVVTAHRVINGTPVHTTLITAHLADELVDSRSFELEQTQFPAFTMGRDPIEVFSLISSRPAVNQSMLVQNYKSDNNMVTPMYSSDYLH